VITPTTLVSRGPGETEAAGERLAASLGPGDVVALTGELGAGKTCFVQGVARGLGVRTQPTSPTFVLINEYRGRLPVHHVDAYRVDSLGELQDLGLDELMDGDGVTLVEWADKLWPLLPARTIHVHLVGVGDEPRTITVSTREP
jgi:tRNA threonylcarbamoyladenosine biosynthesis protein TsaE